MPSSFLSAIAKLCLNSQKNRSANCQALKLTNVQVAREITMASTVVDVSIRSPQMNTGHHGRSQMNV